MFKCIAAIVIENNTSLITRNTKHFKNISELKIESWQKYIIILLILQKSVREEKKEVQYIQSTRYDQKKLIDENQFDTKKWI